MKRKAKPKKIKSGGTPLSIDMRVPTFHEFFPITLFYKEGKDKKYCYFVCDDHLKKYISRHNLKKGTFDVYDTEPRQLEE